MISWGTGCIIFIILAIALAVFLERKYYLDGGGVFICIILIIVFLITSMICDALTNYVEENIKYEYKNKVSVYSLGDNLTTSGSYRSAFTFGYGKVDSNIYYYTMVGNETDGLLIQKYDSSDTYLIMNEDIQPYYIEKIKIYNDIPQKNWFFGGIFKQQSVIHREIVEKKELHIPKNSVKQNYNVDLK